MNDGEKEEKEHTQKKRKKKKEKRSHKIFYTFTAFLYQQQLRLWKARSGLNNTRPTIQEIAFEHRQSGWSRFCRQLEALNVTTVLCQLKPSSQLFIICHDLNIFLPLISNNLAV